MLSIHREPSSLRLYYLCATELEWIYNEREFHFHRNFRESAAWRIENALDTVGGNELSCGFGRIVPGPTAQDVAVGERRQGRLNLVTRRLLVEPQLLAKRIQLGGELLTVDTPAIPILAMTLPGRHEVAGR